MFHKRILIQKYLSILAKQNIFYNNHYSVSAALVSLCCGVCNITTALDLKCVTAQPMMGKVPKRLEAAGSKLLTLFGVWGVVSRLMILEAAGSRSLELGGVWGAGSCNLRDAAPKQKQTNFGTFPKLPRPTCPPRPPMTPMPPFDKVPKLANFSLRAASLTPAALTSFVLNAQAARTVLSVAESPKAELWGSEDSDKGEQKKRHRRLHPGTGEVRLTALTLDTAIYTQRSTHLYLLSLLLLTC